MQSNVFPEIMAYCCDGRCENCIFFSDGFHEPLDGCLKYTVSQWKNLYPKMMAKDGLNFDEEDDLDVFSGSSEFNRMLSDEDPKCWESSRNRSCEGRTSVSLPENSCPCFFTSLTRPETDHSITQIPISQNRYRLCSQRNLVNGVAYPFVLIKPSTFDGNITLTDINERIHRRPKRAIRHPVGDLGYRSCLCLDKPGLSGKTVVTRTKIYTQGRGIITIIRTKE